MDSARDTDFILELSKFPRSRALTRNFEDVLCVSKMWMQHWRRLPTRLVPWSQSMTMSQMTLREYLRGFQSMEHNSIYLKSSEYLQHNCKYEWDRMKYILGLLANVHLSCVPYFGSLWGEPFVLLAEMWHTGIQYDGLSKYLSHCYTVFINAWTPNI